MDIHFNVKIVVLFASIRQENEPQNTLQDQFVFLGKIVFIRAYIPFTFR